MVIIFSCNEHWLIISSGGNVMAHFAKLTEIGQAQGGWSMIGIAPKPLEKMVDAQPFCMGLVIKV